MMLLKGANLALRFLLELCLLAALGYWGFRVDSGPVTKALLGIGAPLLMAVVWGTFISPKAKVRLPVPLLLMAEVATLGLGVGALYGAGQPRLASIFAAVSVLNRVLIVAWGQEGTSHGRQEHISGAN
jgi:hypothetical protein